MKQILTEDDLKKEIQGERCKEALRLVGVPSSELDKWDSGPLLFQWAHMAVFLEVPWQDAKRWVIEHKAEVFNYAKTIDEQKSNSRPETN